MDAAERRESRRNARSIILAAANAHGNRRYSTRTIGEAVCLVRRRQLVPGKILQAAGFRP